MSEIEYKPLTLNSRMYQYIRASAITNLDDALVELITNCVDAYININNNPNFIDINISKTNKYIEIIDQAIGLDAEKMKVCFLEVGTYVSDERKRGHFSRGAKDITALGDCTFIAIKDNKYSVCKILYDGLGAMIISDADVTDEIRNQTNIINNGFYVKLEAKINDVINNFNQDTFIYHYALRDILSSDKYNVLLNDLDTNTQTKLTYTFPDGEQVINGEYTVPNYNVPAKFTLYLSSDKTMNYSNNFRYTENGILISSNNTIYENGFLNAKYISNNPHSKKLFGRISCDYINEMLKDYENNGPSTTNPFPIIDSSRLQGINYYHPFVKNLILLPIERITYILSQLEYESRNKIKEEQINKLFDIDGLHLINDTVFQQLGINLQTDFKLKKLDNIQLPPIRQQFVAENLNLKYSKPNIKRQKQELLPTPPDVNLTETAKLTLNFVDNQINGKYEVFATNQGIVINISKANYIIKKYVLGASNPDNAYTNIQFKAHVADIISEAFADLLTGVEVNSQNIENLDQTTLINLINTTFNKHYANVSEQIHSIILG